LAGVSNEMDSSPGPPFLSGLAADFQRNGDAAEVLRKRSAQVDQTVRSAVETMLTQLVTNRFAVAGCGGYGRSELFPYSDVDLLIVVATEADLAALKNPLSRFLQFLWDQSLRVSHSVRTVADCVELHDQNIELHISLLDLRFLSGDQSLFTELQAKLGEFYNRHSHTLMKRLAEMSRLRHTKFNDTVFHLEPNIKESPGGIRDWHLLRWLGQLMPQNEAIRESCAETHKATVFLSVIRCFLHFRAGRDHNLLTFDLQDEAAAALAGDHADPAEWMRLYYKCARQISQYALRALEYTETQDTSLVRQFRDWRSRLSTNELTISRERIFLRQPADMVQSNDALQRLFIFIARHGLTLAWDAQRRLRAHADEIRQRFAETPPNWAFWKELLDQPHAAQALQQMQETEILTAAIPEWHFIDSLVVRDFYHRYTVDEHSLVAVGVIDDLASARPATSQRLRLLLKEGDDQALLRMALLLHDSGKGTTPGQHIVGSLEIAAAVMERAKVPEEQRSIIQFLIEHHLDLSLIMSGRDLDDPATARSLTRQVGTIERLRLLTLVTYADISAVNPTAMTPWRLEQLWRVYTVGLEQLTRELEMDRIHGIDNEHHSDFRVTTTPDLERFLEGLPTRYLRTRSETEIRHHMILAQSVSKSGLAVEINRQADAWQATVLTLDRPGLFGMICGALASFGMNIVKAEAATNAAGIAVDQFRFSDPLRTLELNPGEVDQLRWTIERVIQNVLPVKDLLKRRRSLPRPSRGSRIMPSVRFNQDASESATLIDFIGEDRPGLLYELTSAMAEAGCNIEVVMIDTEAHKAIDVFYVTKAGDKLSEADQETLHSQLIEIATRDA
jgi:[protein-PII] uridylyltransferase